jgi:hypothetical protein
MARHPGRRPKPNWSRTGPKVGYYSTNRDISDSDNSQNSDTGGSTMTSGKAPSVLAKIYELVFQKRVLALIPVST